MLECPREPGDQAMENHENLHACELVARTHSRAPAEWNKCERLRTGSFKPRRIELLRLPEILRVPICGVHSPVNLLCAGKIFTTQNTMASWIRSDWLESFHGISMQFSLSLSLRSPSMIWGS